MWACERECTCSQYIIDVNQCMFCKAALYCMKCVCMKRYTSTRTYIHVKYGRLQYTFSHSLTSWWLSTYLSLHYANAPPPTPTPLSPDNQVLLVLMVQKETPAARDSLDQKAPPAARVNLASMVTLDHRAPGVTHPTPPLPSTARPTATQSVQEMVLSSGMDSVSSSLMETVLVMVKISEPRAHVCVCSTLCLSWCAADVQSDAATTTSETSTAIGWQASFVRQIKTSRRILRRRTYPVALCVRYIWHLHMSYTGIWKGCVLMEESHGIHQKGSRQHGFWNATYLYEYLYNNVFSISMVLKTKCARAHLCLYFDANSVAVKYSIASAIILSPYVANYICLISFLYSLSPGYICIQCSYSYACLPSVALMRATS